MALGTSNAFKTLMNAGRATPLQPWTPPAPPPMIAAPAPKPLATQWAKPAVTTTARNTSYQQAPINTAPIGGGGGGTAGISGGAAAANTPAPPIDYSQFTDAMADTDSPFVEQKALYNNALDKFLAEQDRQGKIVNADSETALGGVERNRTAGLTSLNEDLAARGLGRGGIYLEANKEASDQYARQKGNVEQGRDRSLLDLNARTEKMRSDTGNNIQSARREAYNRLVAKQELI